MSKGRLWALRVVSSCLALGLGVIWERGNMGFVCEGLIKEVVGNMDFWIGWFGYDRCAHRQVVCYPSSGRGVPPPCSHGPQDVKHHKIEKIKNMINTGRSSLIPSKKIFKNLAIQVSHLLFGDKTYAL